MEGKKRSIIGQIGCGVALGAANSLFGGGGDDEAVAHHKIFVGIDAVGCHQLIHRETVLSAQLIEGIAGANGDYFHQNTPFPIIYGEKMERIRGNPLTNQGKKGNISLL